MILKMSVYATIITRAMIPHWTLLQHVHGLLLSHVPLTLVWWMTFPGEGASTNTFTIKNLSRHFAKWVFKDSNCN